ncbi:MAG: TonB-dependent receptor [Phenylobacterium sp.]|uniref:TonB-dependent receptor plug domain-containing protein n=1 Tax=Phenylobacterium sp. TaxID=1871053 RepID=UPI0025FB4EE1|nr:TonB-dependent receptor [Phenylobacterium sp.]MBI1200078.1 TonB-dependent receptor [Phenylobacterium sp.]
MLIAQVLAQAAAIAGPVAEAPAQGVVSYGPEFFAAQQPTTALDMVNRIPGFTLDKGDAVRGFEGAAGNVLIDGQRPASKSDDLDDILKRIPASSVARIDVIRGGAPGVDMQGKTVLANIVRTRSGGAKGLVEAKDFIVHDGRHSGGLRVDASGTSDGRNWELSAQARKFIDDGAGDGPGLRTFGSGAPAQPYYIDAEGDEVQYLGTAAYETPLAGGRLRLNGRLFSEKYKSEEADQFFTRIPPAETDNFTRLTHESEVGGRFGRPLGEAADLEAIALRQTHNVDLSDRFFTGASLSDFSRSSDQTETIGRLVLKRRFGERLSFELGGEGAVNKLDSESRLAVDGAPVPLPAANVEVEEKRGEVFLKSSWRPAPRWTIDGGLRYETSTISSDGDVTLKKTLRYAKPRLTVTWAPTATTQLRLRGEREVGQLNFNDFVASANLTTTGSIYAGNPDLNPEQAWAAEVALEQRFWTSGSIVLTARHYELSDVVDRAPVFDPSGAVFDAPANIGDGSKDELKLELTLPTDKLGVARGQLKGDVRRGWTDVTDPTTHESRGISGYHPIDWNVSFSQDVPRWNMTWGVDVYGSFRERYYRFNQIEDFKLSALVRPYIEIRPRDDLNLRLELFNATQRGLRDYTATYPGPRNAGGAPDVQARDQTRTPYGAFIRLQKKFG